METEYGFGFWGTLVLILVILKAVGALKMAWKWIFLPLWGPFALFASGVAIYVIGSLMVV